MASEGLSAHDHGEFPKAGVVEMASGQAPLEGGSETVAAGRRIARSGESASSRSSRRRSRTYSTTPRPSSARTRASGKGPSVSHRKSSSVTKRASRTALSVEGADAAGIPNLIQQIKQREDPCLPGRNHHPGHALPGEPGHRVGPRGLQQPVQAIRTRPRGVPNFLRKVGQVAHLEADPVEGFCVNGNNSPVSERHDHGQCALYAFQRNVLREVVGVHPNRTRSSQSVVRKGPNELQSRPGLPLPIDLHWVNETSPRLRFTGRVISGPQDAPRSP